MKNLWKTLLLLPLTFTIYSQCTETTTTKILMVGDSWAFFMNVDGTINNVSKDWGHSNINYYTNLTLSENGAETDDFLTPTKVTELQTQLANRPEVKVIHLSIGGNDFLGSWNVDFTTTQRDSLANAVIGRLDSIVDIIHTARPDVHVFWSGYVYTNFTEVLSTITPLLQSTHPFYGTWRSMGFPSTSQINSIQNWFQDRISAQYLNDPKFTYIPATGLMQYAFGQTTALGIAPGGTYAPFSVSLPEGDIAYPSPKTTMRDYGITKDCFHLSINGYYQFISYHFQKFYHKFFMDDAYTLASNSQSGTVTSSGTVLQELKVGKSGSEEYAAILHFDNRHMADTALDNLSLFFKIESLTGSNMLQNGQLSIEIAEENFGNYFQIEAEDFAAASQASGTPCIFGKFEEGKWARLELPVSLLSYVHKSNSQIRLKYTGQTDAMIQIVNGSDIDFQPTLNIKYGTRTLTTNNDFSTKSRIEIYPNPATSNLTIISDLEINKISVFAMNGQKVMETSENLNEINIDHLNSGMYLIEIQSETGIEKLKFIKK